MQKLAFKLVMLVIGLLMLIWVFSQLSPLLSPVEPISRALGH
jgi:hypothetical protein